MAAQYDDHQLADRSRWSGVRSPNRIPTGGSAAAGACRRPDLGRGLRRDHGLVRWPVVERLHEFECQPLLVGEHAMAAGGVPGTDVFTSAGLAPMNWGVESTTGRRGS